MIEFRDVTLRAGEFMLERLSFTIEAGAYAVIMGRTGSGKTTILETLCGLRKVACGSILLDGRNITHLGPAERNIGYVPQDLALFETMTVREHLEFAPRLRNFPADRIIAKTKELAELLGIASLLPRKPNGLSGGEAQRVALGRALSFEPPVLLLDEPLSALDEQTREEIQHLLRAIRARTGVTTLHITHSRHEADALATVRFLIEDGELRNVAV
jgi:ABC-type sugar transport system ATPase subunit